MPRVEQGRSIFGRTVTPSYTHALQVGRRILMPGYGMPDTSALSTVNQITVCKESRQFHPEGFLVKFFDVYNLNGYFASLHTLARTVPVDPMIIEHTPPKKPLAGEPLPVEIKIQCINPVDADKVF